MIDVLVGDHLVLEADENLFHVVFGFPLLEDVELCRFNSPIGGVHAWQGHLRLEMHLGGLHGVVRPTLKSQEENTVVEFGVRWPNDSAIPVSEGGVIT